MKRCTLWVGIVVVGMMAPCGSQGREWTDNTGTFHVEAELVGKTGSTVRLRKLDGEVIEVPLDRLSEADLAHLKSLSGGGERRRRGPAGPMVERIERALREPATAEFIKTPLEDVAGFLSDLAEVPVLLDQKALDAVGIGADVPVTVNVKNVALASVLDQILDPLDLAWQVRDEVLLITTPEEAEYPLQLRVYRLQQPIDPRALLRDITTKVAPNSWDQVGGPGSIQMLPPDLLVIAQTGRVQRTISGDYAKHLQMVSPAQQFPVPGPAAARLKTALFQPTQVEFVETWLQDVVDFLQKQQRIPVEVDQPALQDIGIGTDVPVTLGLQGIQLRHVLSWLCRPFDLDWTLTREGIRITTPEQAETGLFVQSYRTNDLVPVQALDSLVRVVTSTVTPASWDQVGGPGSLQVGAGGTLDVRQSFAVQMEIARLFEDIRRARNPRR